MATNLLRVSSRPDHALGALLGLALGDALGMATQELSRQRAEALLGDAPRFIDGPADNPISAGLPAGSVTDDTEHALIVARLLIEGNGTVDPYRLAETLLDWEEQAIARGSHDLLGPSTAQALTAVRGGADPTTTGRAGTTNGAAMRIAPVGIATPWHELDTLIAAVVDACRVTHDTPIAHAGAAAVAVVISAGIDGVPFADALPHALAAAARVQSPATRPGPDSGSDSDSGKNIDLAERIRLAVALAGDHAAPAAVPAALDAIAEQVGTRLATHESVPAAFAVAALAPDDPWRAAWLGARLGGDSDTIAAIAAAMIGAGAGAGGLPTSAVNALLINAAAVNSSELDAIVAGLLALRDQAGTS